MRFIYNFILLLMIIILLTGCQLEEKDTSSETTVQKEIPSLIGFKINQHDSNGLFQSDFFSLVGSDLEELNQNNEIFLEKSDYLYSKGVTVNVTGAKTKRKTELNYHVDNDRDSICYSLSRIYLYLDGHIEQGDSLSRSCGAGIGYLAETVNLGDTTEEVKVNFINSDLLERYTVVQYDESNEKIVEEEIVFTPESEKEYTIILQENCVDYKIIETYLYSTIKPHHTNPGAAYTNRKIFEKTETSVIETIFALDQDDKRVVYTFNFELLNKKD